MKPTKNILSVLLLVLYSLVVVHSLIPHDHLCEEFTRHHSHNHERTPLHLPGCVDQLGAGTEEDQEEHSIIDWLLSLVKGHSGQSGATEQYYKFYKRSADLPVLHIQICIALPDPPLSTPVVSSHCDYPQSDDIPHEPPVSPSCALRAPPALS